MPVRDKTEKEAYCDVCGARFARTCAFCGGVFCGSHSRQIQFKPTIAPFVLRVICKKCLSKATVAEVIKGRAPQSWQGDEYADCREWIKDLLMEEGG